MPAQVVAFVADLGWDVLPPGEGFADIEEDCQVRLHQEAVDIVVQHRESGGGAPAVVRAVTRSSGSLRVDLTAHPSGVGDGEHLTPGYDPVDASVTDLRFHTGPGDEGIHVAADSPLHALVDWYVELAERDEE